MANTLLVVRNCIVSAPRMPNRSFTTGETVYPGEAYYYQLLWSGNATDTGTPWPPTNTEAPYEAVMARQPAPKIAIGLTAPTTPTVNDIWFKPSS